MHGLCWQIKELSAAFIETANQLEKTNRDKVQLISELEVVRSHLDNNDVDYSKATNSMKMSVTHATIERNATVKEAARCKQRVIDAKWEADEERERLTSDRNDLKRRLAKAEQELVDTKEQCITLMTSIAQRQLFRRFLATKSADEAFNVLTNFQLLMICNQHVTFSFF